MNGDFTTRKQVMRSVVNGLSGNTVFWVLAPFFVAVGLYLVWYSHRRKKMLDDFARAHGLIVRAGHKQALQQTIDSCFSLKEKGMVRSFGQLSSIIDGKTFWLFRAVELVDLNSHVQSNSTHYTRIAVLFDIPETVHDVYFVLDKSLRVSPKWPGSEPSDTVVIKKLNRIAQSCGMRHPLSVTFSCGHGLIYFEPLVTGGEKMDDIQSLYCIAQAMYGQLAADV